MEKVKNIFKYKCSNKIYIFLKYIVTTIFALTAFWDSLINLNSDNIRVTLNDIYFNSITFKNIMIGIISWIIVFTILTIIEILISKFDDIYYKKNTNEPIKLVYYNVYM